MISDFLNLLFPKSCVICDGVISKVEVCLCVSCNEDLPLNPTFFDADNFTTKLLYGRLPFANATSLLLFQKKGVVQKLMHELKYRGQEHIGDYFGDRVGALLLETNWFQEVTMVIPVPVDPKRLRKRGYNQVAKFSKNIALALNVPYRDDVLIKSGATKTQVFKRRIARSEYKDEALSLNHQDALVDQHILLVDDIITTGATMEACSNKLLKSATTKISVVSLAITTS